MKQYFIKFSQHYIGDDSITQLVNSFLEEHPNYKIKDFQYIHPEATKINEFLMVLFEVEDD